MASLDGPQWSSFPLQAHAVKFTPVQEGQQHPMGKHGNLKLFHEHVWPKGYSPERLAEVQRHVPQITDDADDGEPHPFYQEKTARALARSTVPIQHLKDFATTDKPLTIAVNSNISGLGMFSDTSNEILIPQNEEDNIVNTFFGHVLLHEMGHARAFHLDPENTSFAARKHEVVLYKDKEMGIKTKAHPEMEGLAEGYRLAHQRETRGFLRKTKDNPLATYKPEGFTTRLAQDQFRQTRQNIFDREVGNA